MIAASNRACLIYFAAESGCKYRGTYRSKLRVLFSLPEEPYSDCFLHTWCRICAITQEYRELQNRGIDPLIGNNSIVIYFCAYCA